MSYLSFVWCCCKPKMTYPSHWSHMVYVKLDYRACFLKSLKLGNVLEYI